MSVEDRLKQWTPNAPVHATVHTAPSAADGRGGRKLGSLVDPRAIVDKERKTAHMVAAARCVCVCVTIHGHLLAICLRE